MSFASELQALLEDETVSREVDLAAVDSYLAYGYVPAPATAFRAVGKLPPAHTLVWRDGRVDLDRYWSLDYGTKLAGLSEDEACERIRSAVRAATRRRMVADVPLGAFLSGGIDSSTVVAAMAEASSSPVKTFSIGFDRQPFDELAHARRIAELFETEHHEFVVRPAAVEVLPRIVRHHGEPFADSSAIPSYYLAEMTRRHVTVALNGDGGDEAFGGYSRYVANSLAGRIDSVPLVIRRSMAALGGSLPAGGAISSPVQRARRLLGNLALDPAERYARYVQIFDGEQRNALYTDEFSAALAGSDALETIVAPWQAASGLDVRDIMLEVDSATYLPGDLIAKIDIATMAHALEARSPLLDHEVLELAAALPAELKIRGREKKWILRQAMRGWIPDEILDRPEAGLLGSLSATGCATSCQSGRGRFCSTPARSPAAGSANEVFGTCSTATLPAGTPRRPAFGRSSCSSSGSARSWRGEPSPSSRSFPFEPAACWLPMLTGRNGGGARPATTASACSSA